MLISVVVPVRNEEEYIENCINSILSFELPKDIKIEVLIMDGLSDDNTKKIVKNKYSKNENIFLIDNPNKIQSTALNLGILRSNGEYILRLDAHTNYPKNYLKKIIETENKHNSDNTGGVCLTQAGGKNFGAQIVQALTTHKFGVGNSNFRAGFKEGYVDTVPFGFFKKSLFKKIGFFDERLVRAQDYEFNARIINGGGKIWMNPEVVCYYYNQKYFYNFLMKYLTKEGPYNAYMWFIAPYTFSFRHVIPLLFSLGVIIGFFLSILITFVKYVYIFILLLYLFIALISSFQQALNFKNYKFLFFLPISFFLFHFLYGFGILIGIINLILGKGNNLKGKSPWN